MRSQGCLGLALTLLALISTVGADRCYEDQYGDVSCEPIIRPVVAFAISISIFLILLLLFAVLARQRRNRIRAANMLYVQNAQAQAQTQQPGFPPSPYAVPYAPPYGPPPPNSGFEYNPEHPDHNKNYLYAPAANAPQYPPPSYMAA